MANNICHEESGVLDAFGYAEAPFGVTLADAEAYGHTLERNALRVHNEPVRDVEKETLWEFLRPPAPGEPDIFTPEVIEALRGWQN